MIFEFRKSFSINFWINTRRFWWLKFFFDWWWLQTMYAFVMIEFIMYLIIFLIHLTCSNRDIVNSLRNWFTRFTWLIWKLYCIAIISCLTTILLKSFRKKTSIVNRIFRDVCSFFCEIYAIIANEITWSRSKFLRTKQLINSFTTRCIHCSKFNCDFVATIIFFNFNDISDALSRTMSQISTLRIKRALTRWEFVKRLSMKQTKWWWHKLRVIRSQRIYIISFVNKNEFS